MTKVVIYAILLEEFRSDVFSLNELDKPQAAQARYESTCGWVILKMAVNIKDLYGNSGNRFEKMSTHMNFQKNTLYLSYLLSSCVPPSSSCVVIIPIRCDLSDFLYPEFPLIKWKLIYFFKILTFLFYLFYLIYFPLT